MTENESVKVGTRVSQGGNRHRTLSWIPEGSRTMEAHVRDSEKSGDVLASFIVDEHSIRVERATRANRDASLAVFHLDGICYALLSNLERSKALTALTRREREIALQIARGLGTKQIAHNLGISPHTAVTYVNRMRNKLGVRNRPEIVAALLGG